MSIKLPKAEIEDVNTREGFKILEAYLNTKFILNFDYKLFEHEFTENGTSIEIPHNLGFRPSDVIVTVQKGSGTLTWLYDQFDSTNLYFTLTGFVEATPMTVRALVGTYRDR